MMNRKKLNILQVVNSPHWHAISGYALLLSKGLKAKGHKVTIITLPNSLLIRRAEAEGIPVITNLRLNHYNPFYFFIDLKRLIKILEQKKIDVLNVHESYGFAISCLAAKLAKRPIALIRTRGTFMTPKGHPLNRYLHNSLSDKVIVTSKFMLEKCLKLLKGNEDHYKLIYLGIDIDKFKIDTTTKDKIRQNLGIFDDEFVIGITARFDPVKGYPYFFEAISKVKQGVKMKLLIIGYEATYSKIDIINMAKKHGIEKDDLIILDSWQDNLSEILSVVDVGVIASIGSEANSRALIEFMASGKPTVATKVGVIPEIIEDKKTGYLVSPKDTQVMAEVLLDLLKDSKKRNTIGANAIKLVKERFTENILVYQTEDIYYQVLEKKLSK